MSKLGSALRGLAGEPPPGAGAGLAGAVAKRVRRRRVVRQVAAATSVVLLVAGVSTAVVRSNAGHRDDVTLGSESPSPDGISPSPSPSVFSSPSGAPLAVAPQETTVSQPGGPSVHLRVVGFAVTGRDTVIEAHIVDPEGPLTGYQFSFGIAGKTLAPDSFPRSFPGAGTMNYGFGDVDSSESFCTNGAPTSSGPTDRVIRFVWSFRVPTNYVGFMRVQTRTCVGIGDNYGSTTLSGSPTAIAVLRYGVTGTLWPNGPETPTVSVGFHRSRFDSGTDHTDLGPGPEFWASDDGAISSVHVDWGDGSSEDVTFKPEDRGASTQYGSCQQGIDEFGAPIDDVVARPDHTYAVPGAYVVTVTATSETCGGGDVQTGTASGTYTWPPAESPSPSPSSSPGA